jgi:acyl dehydratase
VIHFEDFTIGETRTYAGPELSEADIVAFARVYDPQPMHVDARGASEAMIGRLIASGWHTACLHMRMLADDLLVNASSMGAPGIDALAWLKPVFPGDRLSARRTVIDKKQSRSKPDRGFVSFRFEVLNQHDEVVMTQENSILFGCRNVTPAAPVLPAANRFAEQTELAARETTRKTMPFFDELTLGESMLLGSYTFTADDIVTFAKAYDPQSFHTDAAAASRSHFGGLIASGWHTAAIWMKLMVAAQTRQVMETLRRGETPGELGPSPGFKDLKWLKPVRAGDTLTYRSSIADKRISLSRPQWGLVTHRNQATNQTGEVVFQFDGTVFWKRLV